jgi:hypothetical protein
VAAADPREGQEDGGHHRRHPRRHPSPLRVHRRAWHHGRLRHLTVALPPEYAARLFDFRDRGRRAGGGLLVESTDVEHIEFDL